MEIIDIDEDVMSEVLQFIYTGEAPNLDRMADSIIIAADKVCIPYTLRGLFHK